MTNLNEHLTDELSAPADPSGGDRIILGDVLGSLLLFTVHKVQEGIETEYGTTDAISCDVAVLDGALKGTVYKETLIFPAVLRSQLKEAALKSVRTGEKAKVVGRLGQGAKKPGKNAPWELSKPTSDDLDTARKYLAYVAAQAGTEEPF